MWGEGVPESGCRAAGVDLEPTSRASVLLPLSFRKFLLIQLRMSSRQMVREVGGDVDLCVVGVAVKMDPMVIEDCAEGEEVDDEEKWTQD